MRRASGRRSDFVAAQIAACASNFFAARDQIGILRQAKTIGKRTLPSEK